MIKDLNDELLESEKLEPKVPLKQMKRTFYYTRCGNLIVRYLGLLLEIITSYSEMVCYFFMITSMMKNAGLISLVYPFAVFGYALMQEMKPKKEFWNLILLYTQFLILLKFFYQLSFWNAIFSERGMDNF